MAVFGTIALYTGHNQKLDPSFGLQNLVEIDSVMRTWTPN